MVDARLPTRFADLEPYAKWSLPTEAERYAVRLASTMDEIQAFYDAATARYEDAVTYLDQYPLDEMPEEALNLLYLLYSLLLVSFAVECWGQPQVPDTGVAYLDLLAAPTP